jgi:acetyl esterase/lipase
VTAVPHRVDYGTAPSQHLEVWEPIDGRANPPVAFVLHGGYWRDRYDLHLMDPLCRDLAERGWRAVNVEYRRVGTDGGGWPATFDDVRDAMAAADGLNGRADASRVVPVGHSAGGHLALYVAALRSVAAVVALAPVSDLTEASKRGLSDCAVHGLLGGPPADVPARYAATDPMVHLPLGCPTLVVHGDADDNVPIELSEAYVAAARAAGDEVTYQELRGVDHFDVIDPSSGAWRGVVDWLCYHIPT